MSGFGPNCNNNNNSGFGFSSQCQPSSGYKALEPVLSYETHRTIGNLNPLSQSPVGKYLVSPYSAGGYAPVQAAKVNKDATKAQTAISDLSTEGNNLFISNINEAHAANAHLANANISSSMAITMDAHGNYSSCQHSTELKQELELVQKGYKLLGIDANIQLECWYKDIDQGKVKIKELLIIDKEFGTQHVTCRLTTSTSGNPPVKLQEALDLIVKALQSRDSSLFNQFVEDINANGICKFELARGANPLGIEAKSLSTYLSDKIGDPNNPSLGSYNQRAAEKNKISPTLDYMTFELEPSTLRAESSVGALIFPKLNATLIDTNCGPKQWEKIKVTTEDGAVYAEFIATPNQSSIKSILNPSSPASMKFQVGFASEPLDKVYQRIERLFPLLSQDILEKNPEKVTIHDCQLLDQLLMPTGVGQGIKLVAASNLRFQDVGWPYADLSGVKFDNCWFKGCEIKGEADDCLFYNCRASNSVFELTSTRGMEITGKDSFFDSSCQFWMTFQAKVSGKFQANIQNCCTYSGMELKTSLWGYFIKGSQLKKLNGLLLDTSILKRDCPKIYMRFFKYIKGGEPAKAGAFDALNVLINSKLFNTIQEPQRTQTLNQVGIDRSKQGAHNYGDVLIELSDERMLHLCYPENNNENVEARFIFKDAKGNFKQTNSYLIPKHYTIRAVAKLAALSEVYDTSEYRDNLYWQSRQTALSRMAELADVNQFTSLINNLNQQPELAACKDSNNKTLISHITDLRDLAWQQAVILAQTNETQESFFKFKQINYLQLAQSIIEKTKKPLSDPMPTTINFAECHITTILARETPAEYARLMKELVINGKATTHAPVSLDFTEKGMQVANINSKTILAEIHATEKIIDHIESFYQATSNTVTPEQEAELNRIFNHILTSVQFSYVIPSIYQGFQPERGMLPVLVKNLREHLKEKNELIDVGYTLNLPPELEDSLTQSETAMHKGALLQSAILHTFGSKSNATTQLDPYQTAAALNSLTMGNYGVIPTTKVSAIITSGRLETASVAFLDTSTAIIPSHPAEAINKNTKINLLLGVVKDAPTLQEQNIKAAIIDRQVTHIVANNPNWVKMAIQETSRPSTGLILYKNDAAADDNTETPPSPIDDLTPIPSPDGSSDSEALSFEDDLEPNASATDDGAPTLLEDTDAATGFDSADSGISLDTSSGVGSENQPTGADLGLDSTEENPQKESLAREDSDETDTDTDVNINDESVEPEDYQTPKASLGTRIAEFYDRMDATLDRGVKRVVTGSYQFLGSLFGRK